MTQCEAFGSHHSRTDWSLRNLEARRQWGSLRKSPGAGWGGTRPGRVGAGRLQDLQVEWGWN